MKPSVHILSPHQETNEAPRALCGAQSWTIAIRSAKNGDATCNECIRIMSHQGA